MKNKKGNVAIIAIIIMIVAITAGVVGYLFAKKTQAPVAAPVVTQPVSITQVPVTQPAVQPTAQSNNASIETPAEKNSLSICGVTVVVKNKQPIEKNSGDIGGLAWYQLTVGDSMPNSTLEIYCTEKNVNPKDDSDKQMNDVSYVLDIQSDGSSKVNKNLYSVFDTLTLSNINELFSAMNRGYRTGSETIGFSTQKWVYTFSFMNPKEDKNQDTFVISVNQ